VLNDALIRAPGGSQAFEEGDAHRKLAHWNRVRLAPGPPIGDWSGELAEEFAMRRLEMRVVERHRAEMADWAAQAPGHADAFVNWFEGLKHVGPGQGDPLFPWLAEEATLDQMKWFLTQEAAGEAGFDDLVAVTQVKMPERAKLELARNYWDEMGRGNPKGMHGKMLSDLVAALRLRPEIDETATASLALANLMTALATNRRYAWHAIGALGAIELTAPGRSAYVARALKRLGVKPDHRHYFDLHAVLDVRHSEAWNLEVLHPLVSEAPERARWIAEGALIRLQCGARCFEAYRYALWADGNRSAGPSIHQPKETPPWLTAN
jgi:hypothetical protein